MLPICQSKKEKSLQAMTEFILFFHLALVYDESVDVESVISRNIEDNLSDCSMKEHNLKSSDRRHSSINSPLSEMLEVFSVKVMQVIPGMLH